MAIAPMPLPSPSFRVPLAAPQPMAGAMAPVVGVGGLGQGPASAALPPPEQAAQLSRIKRNVAKMVGLSAPKADIDRYIASEGVSVEQVRAWKGMPGETLFPSEATAGFDRTISNAFKPKSQGLGMNLAAGLNNSIYTVAGYPADAARNAINWGVAGKNALTNQPLTSGMIPDDNLLGSKWISNQFERVGVRDPSSVVPTNEVEKLARAAGEGIGYTVAPEMAVGAMGARAPALLGTLFGRADGVRAMTGNAVAGGFAGVGAQGLSDAVPEQYKPLAATVGGLGGGGLGALVAGAPRLAGATARAAGDYLAPMTAGGRERMAAETLRAASDNPAGLGSALDNAAGAGLVPGSKPTTFQATGDMGLGALERSAAAKDPASFNQRRADQNAARISQMEALRPDSSPATVADALRQNIDAIDQASLRAETAALDRARQGAEGLGAGRTPETAGDALRASYETARAAVKEQERALWEAVDPRGDLNLATRSTKSQAVEIQKDLPASAKPPEGEEAAIYNTLGRFDDVMPLREVTALQSRLKAAMREERMAAGESPAYRRMSQLSAAMQKDLDGAVEQKVAADVRAVKAGQMAPEETTASRLAANAGAVPKTGSAVYTPSGQRFDVEYRVIDASQATASNLPDMRPNPAYPSELQPRSRDRSASELQVSRIAADIQPERLGASSSAAEGAPIIGPDGMVESGNARMMALQRAYQSGRAGKYVDWLKSQGFNVDGLNAPVLVRVRQTPLDDAGRVRFAQEANASPVLSMSASERAAADASRIDAQTLSLYRGGDVASAENRDFVRAFLGKVANSGEEGAFATRGGDLSLEGAQRVRSALLSSAYGDSRLIEALADAGDESIQAFGKALSDVAGDVARLKAGIAEGRIDPAADLSPSMVDAARFVWDARRKGVSLPNAVAQQDAFNPISAEAYRVLQAGYGENLAGRISRERFDAIAKSAIAEAEQQTTEARLFGAPMAAGDILSGAVTRYAQYQAPGDFAQSSRGMGPGNGSGGAQGGGFAASPNGPGSPVGSSGGPVLERPALTPNLDAPALARLRSAQQATRNRAEVFDNRTLAPIRRRRGSTAPYDMPGSAVPGRLFFAGPKSFDAIRSYRAAVGDQAALEALQDYAVDRLRKTALKPDGTIDPGKLATFRRSHADALRALPELDAKLRDAGELSRLAGDAAENRRMMLQDAKLGAAGRLAGLSDPSDVVRVVGGMFGRNDAVALMTELRKSMRGNRYGEDGLKAAVVEHMTDRFISNTEAATSGQGAIKSDQLQTFIRRNKAALAAAGFTAPEIDVMARVARDLQQANRSVASVRLPGGSNTAQDLLASKVLGVPSSLLKSMAAAAASGTTLSVFLSPLVGGAAAIGGAVGAIMRENGIRELDELVKQALLDPALARLLLKKHPVRNIKAAAVDVGQRLRRSAPAGALSVQPQSEREKADAAALAERNRLRLAGEPRERGYSLPTGSRPRPPAPNTINNSMVPPLPMPRNLQPAGVRPGVGL